jgi:hypothetical protein
MYRKVRRVISRTPEVSDQGVDFAMSDDDHPVNHTCAERTATAALTCDFRTLHRSGHAVTSGHSLGCRHRHHDVVNWGILSQNHQEPFRSTVVAAVKHFCLFATHWAAYKDEVWPTACPTA